MENLLTNDQIMLNTVCSTKDELFDIVSQRAFELGICDSADGVKADLLARESEMATGINCGFAIPHTKSAHVQHPAVMFVRTTAPLEWETLDGSEVTRVIALLVPESGQNTHLRMIAHLASSLMDPEFIEFLSAEEDVDALREKISERLSE
ncbi:PTS sugar transporter subunit IIA [Enorma phocaeensis]|uniref:PTS sugar transporter subunit IIA n=1 Tax=Enorma phocaeensis TaxID=1871019 RepID=UPI00195BE41C|nr:PTS sugar transporter subunit IIA [Enorma phocaeensis]MBM6953213.1 PTS sugar transporter subunit IIA [Enorma phocaeensis]